MKKNKKKLFIIMSIILVLLSAIVFFLVFKINDPNALNLEENKWIEQNKANVVDIAVLNDIPVLSYEGEGIIYQYLDYVTKNYYVNFNVIPYKVGLDTNYNNKINIVDEVSENDIQILKDNLVMLSNNNIHYTNVTEMQNITVGVLKEDKEKISNYLNNNSITYVEYDNYTDLKNSIIVKNENNENTVENELQNNSNISQTVDSIIILKSLGLKELLENNLTISYQFTDLNKYIVLSVNGNQNLCSILKKIYNKWNINNFDEKYNESLVLNYYKFKKISDVEQKTLKSKSYVYGFINYGIYNYLNNNKISGINGLILKDFNKFSGLSITYTQYNSISKLIEDFNINKVDFIFNIINPGKYQSNNYNTVEILDKKLFVVSDFKENIVINNINSLRDKEVLTIKDSYIEQLLINNNIKHKSYNNMEQMIKDFKNNNILLIDFDNYSFYKSFELRNTKIDYILDVEDDYKFVISNQDSNKLFQELFNFYLSYIDINRLIKNNYESIANVNFDITYLLILIIIILVGYVGLDFYNHIKKMFMTIKKNNKDNFSKEEKILYIDQLTSLKNRTYLNSKIESWDDSEVYPQAIVVIDLNNISYINDNYGREEGDKVITEAANVLIQNQLSNSEIIRTDGNEFLIYLVGYNEKQIVSYLRKLSKEFKNLSHGFGAASGYSIILDAIKTFDDAVNEATIAMKENKEDIDY